MDSVAYHFSTQVQYYETIEYKKTTHYLFELRICTVGLAALEYVHRLLFAKYYGNKIFYPWFILSKLIQTYG